MEKIKKRQRRLLVRMPYYPFSCDECMVVWSIKAPMSKVPQRRKCPECRNYRNRLWSGKAPGLVFKGDGWETNSARDRKLWDKGMDKDTANEWYKENIDNAEERISTGGQHYKVMKPNYEYFRKKGVVKKISDKKANKRMKQAEKLTRKAYDQAGLDPTKARLPQE